MLSFKSISINLLILILSLIISIYSIELILKFNIIDINSGQKKIEKQNQLYFERTGKKFNRLPVIEEIGNLKKNNIQAVATYFPGQFTEINNSDDFPLSGLSNTWSVFCNENGYYSKYFSDRYGFNNPDDEWDKTEIEYLLIGDSFVHGACVDRPNDIASQLRIQSNKNSLNLGQGSIGPLLEFAIMKEYNLDNVKKILWFFYEGNDIEDLKQEINNNTISKYYYEDDFTQNTKLRKSYFEKKILSLLYERKLKISIQAEIATGVAEADQLQAAEIATAIAEANPEATAAIAGDVADAAPEMKDKVEKKELNFKLTNTTKFLTKMYSSYLYEKHYVKNNEEFYNIFSKILEKANKYTKGNNPEFIFVYLPEWKRYSSFFYNKNKLLKIKSIVTELNIRFINMDEEVFSKEDDPLNLFSFKMDNHYTKDGYKKIAKFISNNI